MPNDNTEDLDLPHLINHLRRDISFDRLERAIDGRVSSATLQRLGDPAREFATPVRVESLVAAAEAINAATPNRTTPWALWVAHGVGFSRTHGLWGRPSGQQTATLALLPTGWERLESHRLAAWSRVGAALIAEQAAEEAGEQAAADAAEVEQLRARVAELEEQLSSNRRKRPPQTR